MTFSVLHFSTADNLGGSGRAAYRIHSGLKEQQINSKMLVGQKSCDDEAVSTVYHNRWWKLADQITDQIMRRLALQYLFYPSTARLLCHPWVKNSDIVQLYNTHGGYFAHPFLPLIARKKPLVWRMSDMWLMTGHCAYAGNCDGWLSGCQKCPDLRSYPDLPFDTARFLWKIKKTTYQHCNLHIVAPSKWILAQAKKSPLLCHFPMSLIPNGINTKIFKKHDKAGMRNFLQLPQDKVLLLFAAHVLADNPRKGGQYVIEVLKRFAHTSNIALVLVGQGELMCQDTAPVPIFHLGDIKDDRLMAAAYSAADILLLPSVVDNLPNTLLEAMACGCPALGFDIGGIDDALLHQKTGYLVAPGSVDALETGILKLLDRERREQFGKNASEVIHKSFSYDVQTQRFMRLYEEILLSRKNKKTLGKTPPL